MNGFSMMLLLFAHPIEARATIDRLKAEAIEEDHLYEWERGHLLITGVGPIAAAVEVARHLHLCDAVWNLGFAGGLRPDLSLGQFNWIGKVEKHFSFAAETPNNAIALTQRHNLPVAVAGDWSLITSDYPIHHQMVRDQLAKEHHVVDMEGYAIARAAQAGGKGCRIGKLVSDTACERGWETIKQRQTAFSEQLADHLTQALS